MKAQAYLLLGCVALAACQSTVPRDIREAPAGSPSLTQVREHAAQFAHAPVRWGGKIVKIENKEQETWIEVIDKTLDDEGRPTEDDVSAGRFLVRSAEFLDPAIYRADRAITVRGVVEGLVERKIGERPYAYPVVRSQQTYLWDVEPKTRYGYDPWYPSRYYYDPYFGYPYYPWGGPRFRFRQGFWW